MYRSIQYTYWFVQLYGRCVVNSSFLATVIWRYIFEIQLEKLFQPPLKINLLTRHAPEFGCRATQWFYMTLKLTSSLTTWQPSQKFVNLISIYFSSWNSFQNERTIFVFLIWLMKHLVLWVLPGLSMRIYIQICTTPNVYTTQYAEHFQANWKKENGNAVVCRTSSKYTENETDKQQQRKK